MNIVQAYSSLVSWKVGTSLLRATVESTEVLVDVRQQSTAIQSVSLALIRGKNRNILLNSSHVPIRAHVLVQRRSTPVIQEQQTTYSAITPLIGRVVCSQEIGEKCYIVAIVDSWSCDSCTRETHIGCGVVSDDEGVDEKSDEEVFRGCSVGSEKSVGVEVADGGI
jgi:hypothetical protein